MVSVIIPAYNYGRFLSETLDSVLRQSYDDFECIIVDNGSTDNTSDIILPYLQDTRFKYIKQENLGVSVARNVGLKQAKGEYILFLDADDLIEKDKLKASVSYLMKHKDCDLVYSNMRYFKSENPSQHFFCFDCDSNTESTWMKKIEGKGLNLIKDFIEGNIMVISSPVFKKGLMKEIGVFDEDIHYNEDWDFWFRMALENKRFKYLEGPETKALIRVHKTSASVNVLKMQICGWYVLIKNSEKIKSSNLERALEIRINQHKKLIAKGLFKLNTAAFKEYVILLKKLHLYSSLFSRTYKNNYLAKLNLTKYFLLN